MKCMILAAGLGTRLRPWTLTLPKPSLPILNVPLIYYSTELIKNLDFSKIVANAHYKTDIILDLLKRSGLDIELSLEKDKPMGSGGALKCAEKPLSGTNEPILCVNADNILLMSDSLLRSLIEFHNSNDSLATLMSVKDPRVGAEFNGLWASGERVFEIAKQPGDSSLQGFHFTGMAIYSQEIFEYLPKGESNIFRDAVMPAMINGQKVLHFETTARWFETGDEVNFLKTTTELLESWPTNQFLRYIVGKFSPQSQYLESSQSVIDQSATIGGRTHFSRVVVGPGATLGSDCRLEQVVVLPGGKVSDGKKLYRCIIGP